MIISKALSLESRISWYDKFVNVAGKDLTDRLRHSILAPLNVFYNRKWIMKMREVFTYYHHSTMKNLTDYELVNQSLFSSSFSHQKRLSILSFQYKFLYQSLTIQQRNTLIGDGITCWTEKFEEAEHRIVLKISQQFEYEGCMSLVYAIDKTEVFILSFTICSGADLGFEDRRVVLISRIQGSKGKHEDIAKAAKQMIAVFPASALMSALEGLCLRLGITKIVCISARHQVSINSKDLQMAEHQYDEFWKTFEGQFLKASEDYLISVPFTSKSEKLIRSKFRKRTMAKRALRKNISQMVQTNSMEIFSLTYVDSLTVPSRLFKPHCIQGRW